MFVLAAGLFFIAEVAAFAGVGEQIGFGWAVLLLIGVSALGPMLVRRVGLGVLGRAQERLALEEVPGREVLDGVVVLAGGVLVTIPGFITDALGLLLMIGPIRSLLIRFAGWRIARRVQILRPARWRVVNVRSVPTSADGSDPSSPAQPMIGPPGHPGDPTP